MCICTVAKVCFVILLYKFKPSLYMEADGPINELITVHTVQHCVCDLCVSQ